MRKADIERLRKIGYRITDTQEFLGLSDEEVALIDLKLSLIRKLKEARKAAGVTQKQLAGLMNSSQSRIALLEGGSPDVSLELICKALFALGLTRKEIGKTISMTRAA